MTKVRYSDSQLVEALQSWTRKNGSTPSFTEINRSLGISTTLVRRFGSWNKALNAADLVLNEIHIVPSSTESVCVECRQNPITEFGGRCSTCYRIVKNKTATRCRGKQRVNGGVPLLRTRMIGRCVAARNRAREQEVPFNLTSEMLMDQFDKQKGLCYYTGRLMDYASSKIHADLLSLDRKTPSLGYVKDNIVFCTYFVNSAKGALSEEGFYTFCRSVLSHLDLNTLKLYSGATVSVL